MFILKLLTYSRPSFAITNKKPHSVVVSITIIKYKNKNKKILKSYMVIFIWIEQGNSMLHFSSTLPLRLIGGQVILSLYSYK